jgi:Tfp pilus assembly pilus retraction ATPase PilT
MQTAISLAGTGHLVLATLHANNCAETLDRVINMFPREQHPQIFLDLSQYLKAIMGQRLVVAKDAKRVAAVEVMINTPHISERVKKGDVTGVKEAITRAASAACRASIPRCTSSIKRIALRSKRLSRTRTRAPTSKPRSTSARARREAKRTALLIWVLGSACGAGNLASY